jgi:3-methyl-2-oxobutanoate hydroxymethyltransferase
VNDKVTVTSLQNKKDDDKKITMLTAYDYQFAKLIDEAGLDIILVGDSLGMVVLGYDTTLKVTLDDMIYHTQAVARGSNSSLVVTDLPFMAYKIADLSQTVINAGKIIKEGNAQAVKLEGGRQIVEEVAAIIEAGIPVMGHLGLTPQSVNQVGGFKVQAKTEGEADKLVADAKALEQAGVFALVLECIPAQLAKRVTDELTIPTIGIGAGKDCDGQVLVTQDMLGFNNDFSPKFVKEYADLAEEISAAIGRYKREVEQGEFPTTAESF